ncbi:hypothetical protein EC973_003219 [Apophysomyces ossiformis]|uniref:Uncharacterized protein n=1 Tax=Apophysomyces ossiformis TaxID=679940 RepID=A0A8H7BZP0_9FUNG|nr:hypothetical protein EC973_003219 [Apophysomyces ossiformis]
MDDASDEQVRGGIGMLQMRNGAFKVIQGYHCLSDHLPLPYDGQGSINSRVLEEQQRYVGGNVVGYFRFRRQTTLALSVRERQIMHDLNLTKTGFRCMAIITSFPADGGSTHIYDYHFWDFNTSSIPVNVINMTESTLAYRQFLPSTSTGIHPSARTRSIHDCISNTLRSDHGLTEQYDQVYGHAMAALQDAAQKLTAKENELEQLRKEIESIESLSA